MPETRLANIFDANDFKDIRNVIVAVSGGSDSLALLFLVQYYIQSYNRVFPNSRINIIAATVDHQLRSESAAEALWVKELCHKHGITHHSLSWTGEKPISSISAKARLARYKLLYNCALAYEKPILLTGHTLNDQIETFIMREKRGNWRGLAAMARTSLLFNQISLLRPLLEQTKSDLRQYLHQHSQNWLDDPSNTNIKYERVRTRQTIGELDAHEKLYWTEKLHQQSRYRLDTNEKLTKLIMQIQPQFIGEVLQFTLPAHLESCETISFAIGLLATIIGGSDYLPQKQQFETLKNFASTKQTLSLQRMNLRQAIIEKKAHRWRIWRENRHIASNICLPNSSIIWDRRYKIINNSSDSLIISTANKAELADISKRYAIDPYYHQSSLALSKNDHFILPFFNPLSGTGCINSANPTSYASERRTIFLGEHFKQISIVPYIAPYNWLISGFDIELFKALERIFNFTSCSL